MTFIKPLRSSNSSFSLPARTSAIQLSCAALLLAGAVSEYCQAQPRFKEVTGAAGVAYFGQSHGGSWGDFNGDGLPDLWMSNHGKRGTAPPALYVNNGDGTFRDESQRMKGYRPVDLHGGAWADFDRDGDQDLYAISGGDNGRCFTPACGNLFFINNNGRLVERAADFKLLYPRARGRMPLWFDHNFDGQPDLFLANWSRPGGDSILFTQQNGRFVDQTGPIKAESLYAQLSLSNRVIPGSHLLIVHSDNSLTPPHFGRVFRFDRGFKEVTAQLKIPHTFDVQDMAVADFDGDLYNDLYMARISRPWGKWQTLKDRFLVQTANGFRDRTDSAGLGALSACSAVAAADFDNDMDIDLYLVCFAKANAKTPPNLLYENLGNGKFRRVTGASAAPGTVTGLGEGVAIADYDQDGFVDLLVTNGRRRSEGPNQLYRNLGNRNHWIQIDLRGTRSNPDGIGARVLLTAGGRTQLREQNGGIHRTSQNHQRIHFGLGSHTRVDTLTIEWPSGTVQQLTNLGADRIYRISEDNRAAGNARIGDLVWHDRNGNGIRNPGEPGLAGASVQLHDCDGGHVQTRTTGSNGQYWFSELPAGRYRLRFIPPHGFTISPRYSGAKRGLDSNPLPNTGWTVCQTLAAGQTRMGIDAGMR